LSSFPFKSTVEKSFTVRQLHSSMFTFEVVQAIQSAGVGVIRLDLRRTVVALRFIDDQDVGKTAVIRLSCAVFFSFFFSFHLSFFFLKTCLVSNNTTFCTMVVASTGFSFPAILFSLSASYNLIIFYELALSLVICPFPAILFSLSASYNLIIFYKLILSLDICPFPAILFS
jgi:hypothetical protein